MPIKSFRGRLVTGDGSTSGLGVDVIPLSTNNGSTGYRITKLQLFPDQFGTVDQKSTVTIFSIPQTVPSNIVDFSDNTLLGAAVMSTDNSENNPLNSNVVFDNMTFNQDIFVCHRNSHGDVGPVNYYIELEQIKLSLDENTVATLRDIRNIESQ
tara:strand:- start:271 stop:732 length:462 start_codon:yes stop_codon:yes gene_type:complete